MIIRNAIWKSIAESMTMLKTGAMFTVITIA